MGATSLPRMSFSDLTIVRFFESSSGRVPDSFLDSLSAFVVYSTKFDLAIGGSLLVDSVCSFHLHLADPSNPVPGLSQGGDSIVPFLYRLAASLGASPFVASGADGVYHREGLDVTWLGLGSFLPLSSFPSSSSTLSSCSSFGFSCRPIVSH